MMLTAQITTLKESPQHRNALIKLIEENFPKGSPTEHAARVQDEFHLLLGQHNEDRVLMLVDEHLPHGTLSTHPIVACASYKIFDVKVKGSRKTLKCAGIGLVVTHKNYQRQGYGHRIQAEIEQRAQKEGALLCILWSDLVSYYTGLGYLIAGTEMQWQLDVSDLNILKRRLEAEVHSPYVVEPLKNYEPVKNIFEESGFGPQRNFAEYEPLFELPNTYAFAAKNKPTQKIEGYAIMGKARDMRDTIHEIVGSPACVGTLLKEMVKFCASGLRVQIPTQSPLNTELEHWLGKGTKSALAFFKVLQGPQLAEWIQSAGILPAGIGITSHVKGFTLLNRHIAFFESQDFGHLVQLFLGPWSVSELEDLPSGLLAHLGSSAEPIALYFFGFDSV